MAIAFDLATDGGVVGASPFSFSHTVTGSNPFLIVTARIGTTNSGADLVTGITYNGVALTKAGYVPSDGGLNYFPTSVWYLNAPATGSHTVTVTTSSGTVTGMATSYNGVAGGYDSATNGADAATPNTISHTTIADNCWIFMAGADGASDPTAGSGMTARVTNRIICEDTNGAKSPAGAYSVSFQWTGGVTGRGVAMSFSPTGGAVTVKSGFFLFA